MSKNILTKIQIDKPKRNRFDLSHDVKLSMNMGELVPVLALECIPGDKFNIGAETMVRLAPLISPMMHRCDSRVEYFFVPNRIIWDDWEKWITNNAGEELPLHPYFIVDNGNYTRLMDYFGIPPVADIGQTEKVSALPFAAYRKIWYDYYRDQNMQAENWTPLINGNNNSQISNYGLQKRAWEHDYFTSSLPFAQKGEAVDVPLGDFNDVPVLYADLASGSTLLDGTPDDLNIPRGDIPAGMDAGEVYAKTSSLTGGAVSISTLRTAFALQRWLEKAARVGSRYVEFLRGIFNVKSSDARLQRPEYIVGVKTPINISEVLNTTGTDELPQGNMAGHGLAYASGNNGTFYCEEHGYIIGIMSIMPKTGYQQGIPRHFLKYTDPTQLFTPDFANIGEQEVLNKELYAWQGDTGNETFGYQSRYVEYKDIPNRVAGDFRDTLAFWHMGRIFDGPPVLNANFIVADPTHRVFAVEDPETQKCICQVYHKISATRSMPLYGSPW